MASSTLEEPDIYKQTREGTGYNSLVSSPSPSSLLSSSSSSVSYEIEGEVGREVLAQICYSALSRLLDFPDDKLEVLISSSDEPDSNNKDGQSSIARNIRSTLRSALPRRTQCYHKWDRLQEAGEDHHDGPSDGRWQRSIQGASGYIVMRLIPHLETMVSTEGLFRVPGSKSRISKLTQELQGADWIGCLSDPLYKPHDFASALKQHLVDLEAPLLPTNHLEAYLQIAGLESESSQLKALQLLTLLLHPTHRMVFQNLLELLWTIAQHESENKMSARSLAVVFSPNLIWTSSQPSLSGGDLERFASVVELMISNCYDCFEVPADVQVPAERHLRKKSTEGCDTPLHMTSTFCRQVSSEDFHSAGQSQAQEELQKLLSHVHSMPEGSLRTQFLKKYESNKGLLGSPQSTKMSSKLWKMLTPSKIRHRKRVEAVDADTPTPQKRCFRKGSLRSKSYSQCLDQAAVPCSPLAQRNTACSLPTKHQPQQQQQQQQQQRLHRQDQIGTQCPVKATAAAAINGSSSTSSGGAGTGCGEENQPPRPANSSGCVEENQPPRPANSSGVAEKKQPLPLLLAGGVVEPKKEKSHPQPRSSAVEGSYSWMEAEEEGVKGLPYPFRTVQVTDL